MHFRKYAVSLLTLALAFVPAAMAQFMVTGFTTITLPGSISSEATGVNSSGTIVGAYVDAMNLAHGYYLLFGTPIPVTVDYTGSIGTWLFGINAASPAAPLGTMVGAALMPNTQLVAFSYNPVTLAFTTIGPPSSTYKLIAAFAINDRGQTAGAYGVKLGSEIQGWMQGAGGPASYPVDVYSAQYKCNNGPCPTSIQGISNSQRSAWIDDVLSLYEAFKFDEPTKTWTKIQVNGAQSIAGGINNSGDIAQSWCNTTPGTIYCGGGKLDRIPFFLFPSLLDSALPAFMGALYRGDTGVATFPVNYPGSAATAVLGLSDRNILNGQITIVGSYSTALGGPQQAFQALALPM